VDDQEWYQLLDKGGIIEDVHLFNDKLRELVERVARLIEQTSNSRLI
jgi:hypothetical protein